MYNICSSFLKPLIMFAFMDFLFMSGFCTVAPILTQTSCIILHLQSVAGRFSVSCILIDQKCKWAKQTSLMSTLALLQSGILNF